MHSKWRVLLLDTKPGNINHYIVLGIEAALAQDPRVESVHYADYADALFTAVHHNCNLFIACDGEELDRGLCQRRPVDGDRGRVGEGVGGRRRHLTGPGPLQASVAEQLGMAGGEPCRFGPWQTAHCCVYAAAPRSTTMSADVSIRPLDHGMSLALT